MSTVRIAQYGTKHGHAAGKLLSLRTNPQIELAGVFEPDAERRHQLDRDEPIYRDVRWFKTADEVLGDPSIVAVASEGRNDESLDQTEQIVSAGKHVWYDKPAGDNWQQWQRVVALAQAQSTAIQMGYMFRYHAGFRQVAEWIGSGLLGNLFCIRAHMSTYLAEPAREVIAVHQGGILYDLGGHMLDQICWLLGRPTRVTAFLRNDAGVVPDFKDNTLGVLEFEHAMAFVDIAATEVVPMARRFEVYGSRGSAILEPFEPAGPVRLCLSEASGGFIRGEQFILVEERSRQRLYDLELEAFLAVIRGERPPERPYSHDLRVQETLLRATGGIPD
jgi:predicted dehydrogenase